MTTTLRCCSVWFGFLCLFALCGGGVAQSAGEKDARVVLVMTDGLRWQEVFRGADANLLTPKLYFDGRSVDALKQSYLRGNAEERRRRLMPFLWGTVAAQGVIFGDRDAGAEAYVTNGFNFSYPGYSETLTGHPDPRIDSNDNRLNPNRTVLEWIGRQPGFAGSVAAFGAWETIAYVVNPQRCGCVVNAGYAPFAMEPMTPELTMLNRWKLESPRVWEDEPFDAPEFYTAMEYVKQKKPRVLFLSLGETDDWAHGNNYGEYLSSAHRVDAYLEQLWTTLQAMPEYHGKTTLIFTTDHGRGSGTGPETGGSWESHGKDIPNSKNIFVAVMGPGVPAMDVAGKGSVITQSQIAATLSGFLGLDWTSAEPDAAKSIPIPLSSDEKPTPDPKCALEGPLS